MSSQITWSIEKLWVQSESGGLTDVVMTAEWKCSSDSGNSVLGNSTFSIPSIENFTPYSQVTEDQVLSWCWSGSIDRQSVEASISSPIESISGPTLLSQTLPWKTSLQATSTSTSEVSENLETQPVADNEILEEEEKLTLDPETEPAVDESQQ